MDAFSFNHGRSIVMKPAPVIVAESPVTQNKKCCCNEEATKASHRSAQAFYFANRLVAKSTLRRPTPEFFFAIKLIKIEVFYFN